MSRLIVNPNLNNLDNFLTFISDNGFCFEIFFCNPEILDSEERIEEQIITFSSFTDKIYSMHGAFYGLQITASDSKIRNASRSRIIQNCEICKRLGISNLVVHCDKLPYILEQGYTDYWVDSCYDFYSYIIDKYGISIFMENCWDLSPYPMKQLINKMNTSQFKGCIDTGHINCFSKAGINEWIDVLNTDLVHFHFSDNSGKIDEHKPAGQGSFDFKSLTERVAKYGIKPSVVFEMNTNETIENIRSSIDYLKTNAFYPYNVER
jgi:sugar phosphate isomerase/epimerase